MLEAMAHLSLLYLQEQLNLDSSATLDDIRNNYPSELNSLLVESSEKIKRAYVLSKTNTNNADVVKMSVVELTPNDLKRLPFNRPSGSQSPAIGPVIKRTFAEKKIGPTKKIQSTTQSYFLELSKQTDTLWSTYFTEILEVLSSTELVFDDKTFTIGKDNNFYSILDAAISLIPEKETVFLTIADKNGKWPGDRKDYWDYLSFVLAEEKYLTKDTPIVENQTCPLCGTQNTNLYPNAIKGAGLNLYNVDREGCFDQLRKAWAWKSYALCLNCADLLYVFKNHLMPSFITRIAGDKCFVLPDLLLINKSNQQKIIHKLNKFLIGTPEQALKSSEVDILSLLKDENESSNFTLQIIWAKFGQVLDDLTGVISEVLPSRLNFLSQINEQMNNWEHPFAPINKVQSLDFDINLNFFYLLFERPGGKKVDSLNNSVRLFETKRALASAIYREEQLTRNHLDVIWKEILDTARCYLNLAGQNNNWQSLLDENDKYITLACWVKHLTRFLQYLSNLEVYLVQEKRVFEPEMKTLKPYFTPDGGINSLEKAFAFLLGILFGKLVLVQGARGVNLQSNSLTWLKKLNLTGKDLPELYIKIREKLLAYETSNNPDVRALEQEVAKIAIKLGSDIKLDNVQTCYFLLLGQSVSRTVLPTKKDKEENSSEQEIQ